MNTDNLIGKSTMQRLATAEAQTAADDSGWQYEIARDFADRQPYDPVAHMTKAIENDYQLMIEERAAGFPADCGTANNGNWYIDTRITRNARYSNNGGDYSYWTEYWHENGRTYRLERCSCDFWEPMTEPESCDGRIMYLPDQPGRFLFTE